MHKMTLDTFKKHGKASNNLKLIFFVDFWIKWRLTLTAPAINYGWIIWSFFIMNKYSQSFSRRTRLVIGRRLTPFDVRTWTERTSPSSLVLTLSTTPSFLEKLIRLPPAQGRLA